MENFKIILEQNGISSLSFKDLKETNGGSVPAAGAAGAAGALTATAAAASGAAIAAAAALLVFVELYQWGYNYAASRIPNPKH